MNFLKVRATDMAHGDYNCCAICDRKLDYAGMSARTKQDICTRCLKSMRNAGLDILDTEELIEWIKSEKPLLVAVMLKLLGFCKCHYNNAVDEAVQDAGIEFEDRQIKKPKELES